eukprot:CAMPEP_0174237478 /NCGR_PEP_ID=MMETSP0417-20130205/8394_1 /TAXON_ID=242541 /ORGANISM="Mayorella sp, Strain BSH-02190019" /LENGTH=269 /DNA_ID=CAMNT_0015316239 /DNA_START=149 /DNA_END=954 /DNA_ORIENTATION=+
MAKQVVDGLVGVLNAAWKIGAGVSVAGLLAAQTLYVVEPGHSALIFDRFQGVKEEEYNAGIHFKVPFVQYPVMFDVRTQPRILRTETGTKDMQMVGLAVRVLYEPERTKLSKIYQNIGLEYADQVLPSIGNEVMKAVVAEYEAHELVTLREKVAKTIVSRLRTRAKNYNIRLRDISITQLQFSPEYTAAVERKQVAQQLTERQRFLVEKAREEKRATIIRVEGETEAARLITEAMKTSPEFLELRKIEAAKEIAETLARSRQITYLPQS